MKRKPNRRGTAGFSLIEIIVAIAVLGLVTVPACGGLVMAHQINAKSAALMEDQLTVTRALETLMESGIGESGNPDKDALGVDTVEYGSAPDSGAYKVTVTRGEVSITTHIRPAVNEGGAGTDLTDPAETEGEEAGSG